MFQQQHKILLASQSPRRKEYLERYQIDFRVLPATIDEKIFVNESSLEYLERIVTSKINAILSYAKDDELIIAADTIVVIEKKILGKPTSSQHSLEMLQQLNGKTHKVITAYLIHDPIDKKRIYQKIETKVTFKQNPLSLLKSYISTSETIDKAGGYAIQGLGTCLIDNIQGSYNNVVGFPIEQILEDLLKEGWLSLM